MAGRGQGGKLGKEGARRGPECSRRKKGFKKTRGAGRMKQFVLQAAQSQQGC